MSTQNPRHSLDFCSLAWKSCKSFVDPQFRMTRMVEDFATGDYFGCLDYIVPGGKCATTEVRLHRELLETLTQEQVVDYLRWSVKAASDDLREFVDGGMAE